MQGFHWRDGWFFDRCPDGSVSIISPNGDTAAIPPLEWASIIAHCRDVPYVGYEEYAAAKAFHGIPEEVQRAAE